MMPETYEVYRYSDDLGGDYERPHLHHTTDDLAEAQAHVAHWGGHVRRVSDGAIWDPGTERWFGPDGPLPDQGVA